MIITPEQVVAHETPNARMRTLAAPSLGTRELSVWEVTMAAGQAGPEHSVDHEQVWVLLEGALRVELDGRELRGRAGDTLVLGAGAARRVQAEGALRAVVASPAAPLVTTAGQGTRALPWGR